MWTVSPGSMLLCVCEEQACDVSRGTSSRGSQRPPHSAQDGVPRRWHALSHSIVSQLNGVGTFDSVQGPEVMSKSGLHLK